MAELNTVADTTAGNDINVNEEKDVMFWAKQFDCSPQDLRIAVARVGVNASDVKEHLQ